MNQQTPQNNEEQKEIIVPPEPTKTPEIQPGFNSPLLFNKEENKEEVSEEPIKQPLNKKKITILVIVAVFVALVAIVSIAQILVDSRFQTFNPNEFTPLSPDDFMLSENSEEDNTPSDSLTCGGSPFIKMLTPEKDGVFQVGETLVFSWELCGINPSLFNTAMMDVYNIETNQKEHTFSLHCVAGLESKGESQEISWLIPDFLEESSAEYTNQSCLLPVVNFLEPHKYQLTISYANNTYSATSEFFTIETGDYVYVPPTFQDYALEPVSSFDRSPFIDSSAPDFLKEIITPSFFQAPPLFSNFYRTYVVPNGPAYLLDLRDGKAYPAPQTSDRIVVRSLSNLYITEEALDTANQYKGRTHKISWNIFDENTKDFDLLFKRVCNPVPEGIITVYTECIPEE